MGLFSRKELNIAWNPLEETSQLDQIIEASRTKPQLIFKHSTRCGVSSMVKSRLDGAWSHNEKIIPWHLDLLRFRNISNEIAERFGIHHESPQIILLKNGQVEMHISHASLSSKDLDAFAA